MDRIDAIDITQEGTLTVDTRVYALRSIKAALLRLSDRLISEMRISKEDPDRAIITAKLRNADDLVDIGTYIDELKIDIIDEDLRTTIASETEQARNLVLAYAFSNTKLVDTDP